MLGFRYPSKKAIQRDLESGKIIVFEDYLQDWETNWFLREYTGENGEYRVVGPDYATNRKWYGTVTVKDGLVVRIR